jgi:hypothetical protein
MATGDHDDAAGENEFLFISNDNFSPAHEALLRRAYDGVYAPVFPMDNGGEPLERWLSFLHNRDDANNYLIIIAGRNLNPANDNRDAPVIKGITVSNYYPQTDTGLLGYVAVDPTFRKEGLGMKLVDLQAEFLQAAAGTRGQNLRGWFLGCFDPAKTDHNYGGYNSQKLVDKYLAHGLQHVPVDYALPATIYDGGKIDDPKVRHYMLMAGRHPETGALPDDRTVMDFIASIFTELGIDNPSADPDFQDMQRQLRKNSLPPPAPMPRP